MSRYFVEWSSQSLIQRIRWLRFVLPPFLAVVVVSYQLLVARILEFSYGPFVHYSIEIAFYSLSGPIVTWLTLVWVERNLEEKEALEHQVRARTNQLEGLMESSTDAILLLDEEDKVISSNEGAARLFGYSRGEMEGVRVLNLMDGDTVFLNRLANQARESSVETEVRHRNGKLIPVDVAHTALTNGNSGDGAKLMIIRDIRLRRERETIVGEERARIGRDLHDGVAQSLYFMALKADLARQQLPEKSDEVEAILVEIGQNTRAVIREVRSTIFALQSPDWSAGDFLHYLEQFANRFVAHTDWELEFELDPELDEIPKNLQPTVFRLIQESLNNVAKHAGANRVAISISKQAHRSQLILKVADNGQGIQLAGTASNGFGIKQMQERVEACEGFFHIDSRKGAGTTVVAELPLPDGSLQIR